MEITNTKRAFEPGKQRFNWPPSKRRTRSGCEHQVKRNATGNSNTRAVVSVQAAVFFERDETNMEKRRRRRRRRKHETCATANLREAISMQLVVVFVARLN